MKRTTAAFLFSLTLHLGGLIALGVWMNETPTPKSERASFRMSAFSVHREEQKQIVPEEEKTTIPEPLFTPPQDTKALPKKRDKIVSKTPMPSSAHEVRDVLESNTTALLEDIPVQTTTHETSEEKKPVEPTYVELYGDAIRQMIEKNKAYPEIARKRALSDSVEVSFTLTAHGEIEELRASSKYKILSNSAIETIQKAKASFPRPMENVTIKIPIIYVIK